MPTYKYKAISNDGAVVTGTIESFSEFVAVERIKESCRIVEEIHLVEKKAEEPKDIFIGKISEKSLALMCSQFSIILKAGLPIVRCVELVRDQTSDRQLKKILQDVVPDVAAGYGLAESFEHKGEKLPTAFVETVRAGEASGTLQESFAKLESYFESSHKTTAKVRSAMMYPMFILVLAVVVIAVILIFAMPVFSGMFESMGTEMPFITRLLIGMSDFMIARWYIVFGVLAAVILAILIYGTTERGRLAYAKLALKMPILGTVNVLKGASQVSSTLATLLVSGLSLIESVGITAKVLDNYHLGLQLGTTTGKLEQGQRLSFSMQQLGCFPDLLIEMISVGEETGAMEETLTSMSNYYASEVETATKKAMDSLQPIITVFLGLVIGFVVIALYMPMFSMYGNM